MRVIGLLSWWDESPTWLSACVASMAKLCDHVVAVDGRYAMYQDDRLQSGTAQVEAIMDSARASGMGLTLHSAPQVWETEMEKRTHLFELGSVEAKTFEDWFFVLDADELLMRCSSRVRETLGLLEDSDTHVCSGRLFEEADPHEDDVRSKISNQANVDYLYSSPTPRLFRSLHDMRVTGCHYYYTGGDAWGKRVALWGQQYSDDVTGQTRVMGNDHDTSGLCDWHSFMDDDLLIENRCLQRARSRIDRRQEYYQLRDASGIENQKPGRVSSYV